MSALATIAVLMVPGTAEASLAEVGVTASNGYPAWYRDASGLTLRLCDDPQDGCTMAEVPNPNAPVSFPDNYPGESFYFAVASESAAYEAALEAAFLGEEAAVDENIVFSRIRIRLDGLVAGARYHITHPYGVLDLVAGAEPDGTGSINYTDDGGCLEAPCNFQNTLDDFVGDQSATSMNFLTRVGFDPSSAQAGAEIGDPLTPTAVQGSPFDTNFFRVEGPNAGGPGVDVLEERRFTIEGQVYGPTDAARPTTPDLAATSDSGRSATDNITTATTPTFSGTAPAGSEVSLLIGTTTVGTAVAGTDGSYSVAPTAAQTSGNKAVKVSIPNPAYDPVANPTVPQTLESGVLNMQIDTTAPTVTLGTPRPTNGTTDSTPTFSFAGNEVGATFECQLTRGTEIVSTYEPCTSPLTYDEQPNGAYKFEVRATDLAGNTTNPATSHSWTIGQVVAAPGTPGRPTATGGNARATVQWTAPTTGGAVTSYTVNAYANNGSVATGTTTVTGTSATITGLTNATPYTFDVVATNSGGSTRSARSAAVTPQAPVPVPGAPTIGTATAGNTTALERWSAPTTGGAPTSYQVQVLSNTGTLLRTVTGIASTARSTTVTGLTNGTTYRFRVRAVNAAGNGALSAQSAAVTPRTVPGAPPAPTATPGATGGALTASASWTAPTDTGGSAITGYVVRALRMSSTGTVAATTTSAVQPSTARQLAMTLPAGNYRFTVQAQNVAGSGAQSARSNRVAAR